MLNFVEGGLVIVVFGLCAYIGVAVGYYFFKDVDLSWVLSLIVGIGFSSLAYIIVINFSGHRNDFGIDDDAPFESQWENSRKN